MAVPLIAWSAFHLDITAVARSLLCASLLLIPVNYWLLTRTIRINALDLVAVLWRPLVGAAIMAAIVNWCENVISFGAGFPSTLWKLLFLVSVGAVMYVAVVAMLWRLVNRPAGAEEFIWRQVIQRARAWRKVG